ncbi:MAG TPA: hypothetical protein PLO78_09040 [Candidatus Omnitrophota bacterium]|nr:hypothetical protein [Candidatus Omnitrophota bacterium]
MKFSCQALALVFLALSFSGCSTCHCKDRAAVAPALVETKAVALPAVPVKTEAVVVRPAEAPVAEAEKIPSAVLK